MSPPLLAPPPLRLPLLLLLLLLSSSSSPPLTLSLPQLLLYFSSSLHQLWLFGYELADTLCVFCANDIHILSSKKKIDFIKPLEDALAKKPDLPKLKLYTRNKVRHCLLFPSLIPPTLPPHFPLIIIIFLSLSLPSSFPPHQADSDVQHFQTIAQVIKLSKRGKVIGVFAKDAFSGPFVEGWKKALGEVKVSQMDVSAAFAFVSAPKDEAELAIVKVCQRRALCAVGRVGRVSGEEGEMGGCGVGRESWEGVGWVGRVGRGRGSWEGVGWGGRDGRVWGGEGELGGGG